MDITAKTDKILYLRQKIVNEVKRLEDQRDGIHYYSGNQFNVAFNAKIEGLRWVIQEIDKV